MKGNYYQKNKEKLQKEAQERYRNLSREKKAKGKKRLNTGIKNFLMKKR